jgi:hypothetical protein
LHSKGHWSSMDVGIHSRGSASKKNTPIREWHCGGNKKGFRSILGCYSHGTPWKVSLNCVHIEWTGMPHCGLQRKGWASSHACLACQRTLKIYGCGNIQQRNHIKREQCVKPLSWQTLPAAHQPPIQHQNKSKTSVAF